MTLKYNEDHVANSVRDKRVAEGKHCIICTDAKKHIANGDKTLGNMSIQVTYRVLKDPEDAKSFVGNGFSEFIPMPFDNPDVDGHVAPDYAYRGAANGANAFFPEECPAYPYFDKELRTTMYKDEPITEQDKHSARMEAARLAAEKLGPIWTTEDMDAFRREVFFAHIGYQEGSTFPNILERHSELPDSWELNTDVMEVVGGPPEPVEEPVEVPAKKTRTRRKRKAG